MSYTQGVNKPSNNGRPRVEVLEHIQPPLFPTKSDWTLPKEFPNLSQEKILGLDTETRDPELVKKGPGVRRGGYIVGISVATQDGRKWYFPFDHKEGKQFEKETVLRWARDNLCRKNQAKVGANILYDLDYLYHENVKISGPFYDIQNAEPLIDENRKTYSLDSLANRYLGVPKTQEILESACKDFGLTGKPQEHIWRLDPKYVGLYAEDDAWQSLQIFNIQKETLEKENLLPIFDIETRLIPMLLHMRQLGVPVNTNGLLSLHEELSDLRNSLQVELNKVAGGPVEIWAAESIARVFDKFGFEYPLTPKTKKPSFVKGWLEKQTSFSIADMIVKCRELDKMIGTFIEGSMLDMIVDDRIHCQFNQLRSDDSGTVTGRFSSSHPNLQFIPTRTEMGKRIRQAFIPDPGFIWCKADYSQIEIRILAHYAMGMGSKEVRKAFRDNRKIDYHEWCADKAKIPRQAAKSINFGIIYGMGLDKLSKQLSIEKEEASEFLRVYFSYLPFIKNTVNKATNVAQTRGYVKTLLGRRRRFDIWEPVDRRLAKFINSIDPDIVKAEIERYRTNSRTNYHQGIQRAFCYKAFNAIDQGTSADIMKKSMVDIWESGLCNEIKAYVTVHDELDFGFRDDKKGFEAKDEVQRIMEKTVALKVPVIVDTEIGSNWGELRKE